MHPEIISIGPFTIRSYGLMLAVAFLSGIVIAARRAKRAGENPDHIYNLSVWVVVSALLGARLYYVVTHYGEFRADRSLPFLVRVFTGLKNMFWPVGADGRVGISGLILYGGLIAATAATAVYLKRHDLSIPKYMDLIGPTLGLGEFFTRIGCFLNGCCFGKPTESWVGVVFPPSSAAGYCYPGIAIHPSQLYNAFAGLVIFFLLLFLERYKRFDGFTALLYFILYSIGRFVIDFSRYYESSMKVFGLSQNQVISLVVFAVCSSLLVYLWRRAGRSVAAGRNGV